MGSQLLAGYTIANGPPCPEESKGKSQMAQRTRRPLALAALAMLALASFAGPVGAANPPGNNGTVKVDKVPLDTLPDNESHPGCTFGVDFYGFDEGALSATATFTVIAPTVSVDAVVATPPPVFIGQDPASGAGTASGFDATVTYDLNQVLFPYMGADGKGAHVKLTVHADGAANADTKYKTFWVTGCTDQGGGGGG